MGAKTLFSVEELRKIAVILLGKHGAPTSHAALQADVLIEAELRSMPSHGLQRLPRLLRRIDRGLVDTATTGAVEWTRPGFLSIDGQRGFGPVIIQAAIERLSDPVRTQGVAMAAIRNANHIGMLAYYAEMAAAQGLISVILTTSEALVHPFGGTEAMLGTNPLAIGIPTETTPFVLDLATSRVSMGKIHHHALTKQPLPDGWAVDTHGHPTTDAEAAKSGALAPFGGAKGYGLGLAIELLVVALTGSAFAPAVRGTLDDTEPSNKGDLIVLIDPAAPTGMGKGLAAHLDRLRASRADDPNRPVAIPGDGARRRRDLALREGIEVPGELYKTLVRLAAA